jgi:nucleoside-diphosphate-sugar epimerase
LIIAVTGSTGFIGSNISRELYSRGHEVLHVDRSKQKVAQLFGPESKFVSSDQSSQSIRENLSVFEPEILIHCSTFFTPSRKPEDLEGITHANLLNPIKIIEASKNLISKFVNLNSYWQIESSENLSTPYACTKEAFRTYLSSSLQHTGIKVHNLFIPETFGPGDNRGKVVQLMINGQLSGERLKLNHPEKKIDLTYVPFLVQMLADFVENKSELPELFSYVNFPSIELGDLLKIVDLFISKVSKEMHNSLIDSSNLSSVFESFERVPSKVLGKDKRDQLGNCLRAVANQVVADSKTLD